MKMWICHLCSKKVYNYINEDRLTVLSKLWFMIGSALAKHQGIKRFAYNTLNAKSVQPMAVVLWRKVMQYNTVTSSKDSNRLIFLLINIYQNVRNWYIA